MMMLRALKAAGCSAARSSAHNHWRSKAVAWGRLYQQADMSSGGQKEDTHDDFKPLSKSSDTISSVREHIETDIKQNPVMVYMKGVPEAPQCGFSAMVVRVLQQHRMCLRIRSSGKASKHSVIGQQSPRFSSMESSLAVQILL